MAETMAASETMIVAERLCAHMSEGKSLEAMDELYADDARQIEAFAMPDAPCGRVTAGKAALKEQFQQFANSIEIHSAGVGKPYPHDDQFIVEMWMDCTFKEGPMAGQRFDKREMGLYTVKDGRITEAKFFYGNEV